MARTIDIEAHTTRRDRYLDAAQRLIQSEGYERMSVQDILDATETSKGAFYHYFDSKVGLLDGVIERMIEEGMTAVQPILDDPDRSAIDKLHGMFSGIAAFKATRRELVLAVAEVWLSDENALVRDKYRDVVTRRLTPTFAAIVAQGAAEGTFAVPAPNETAKVLVGLLLALQVAAGELFLQRHAGTVSFDEMTRTFRAYADAFDRILGAPERSFLFYDEAVLREWFDA
jgi:AcrR family transcriptional regulator